MAKDHLLLVERDAKVRRLLKVSLEQAGYSVDTARDGVDALDRIDESHPAAVLTATDLPKLDGYALVRQLKDTPHWASIPVIFLVASESIEDKIRGLELGVDDYLSKPVFVKELLSRVQVLLAKRVRNQLSTSAADTRVQGRLDDLPAIDLFESLESGQQSGIVRIRAGEREGTVFFQDGEIVDARLKRLRGEEVVFRLLSWVEGTYEVEICDVDIEPIVESSTRALIEAGMRHAAQYRRLCQQLPPLSTVMQVNHVTLAARLDDIPEEINGIIALFDGRRTLLDIIDESPFDDLSTLSTIAKLFGEELLSVVAQGPTALDRSATPLAPEPDSRSQEDVDDMAVTMRPPSVSLQTIPIDASNIGEAAARAVAEPFSMANLESETWRGDAAPSENTPAGELAPASQGQMPTGRQSPLPDEPAPQTPRRGSLHGLKPASWSEEQRTNAAFEKDAASLEREQPLSYPQPVADDQADREQEIEDARNEEDWEEDDDDEAYDEEDDDGRPDRSAGHEPTTTHDEGRPAAAGAPETMEEAPSRDTPTAGMPVALATAEGEGRGEARGAGARGAGAVGAADRSSSPRRSASSSRDPDAAPASSPTPSNDPPAPDVSPLPSSDGPRSSSRSRAEAQREPPPSEPSALSESGVSAEFFASPPDEVVDEHDELPPSSTDEPTYLTEEQLARKDKGRRLVMVVVVALVTIVLFALFRGRGQTKTDDPPRATTAPQRTPPGATQTATAAAAAPATGGADAHVVAAGGADAAVSDAASDEGRGGALPEVDDPLKETERLLDVGRMKDAIPMARAAIREDPENGDAYFYLGTALQQTGELEQAKDVYDQCVQKATTGRYLSYCKMYARQK